MSEQELNRYYSLAANQRLHHKLLKPGEKGAFISHIYCWQRIVAEDLDFALILEDDFIVDGDLAALLQNISQLQQRWHILKLAMPNKQQAIIAADPVAVNIIADNTMAAERAGAYTLVHFKKNPISAVAQAVSKAGAALLLRHELPFGRPVDVAMQYSWQLGFQAMGLWPLIFKPDLGFDSTIAGKQNEQVNRWVFYQRRLEFALANFWYNLRTYGLKALLRAKKWPNPTGSTRLSN